MCGIFGYIGPQNPQDLCLQGLKNLEYRGYDSAGIAGIVKGELVVERQVGKLRSLEQALAKKPIDCSLAIAHTRWATHGEPTQENAHPHFDEGRSLAIVHNGIIENHLTLKKALEAKGKRFYSHTDTEVIAQLVADCYEGDLLSAAQKAFSQLEGTWGIALIHKNHPDQIIAAAKENPLVIGFNSKTKEAFISSDVNAFADPNLNAVFLGDKEIASVSATQIEIITHQLKPVQRALERLQINASSLSKQGYPHFMLKEISEQPETITKASRHRLDFQEGTAHFPELNSKLEQLQEIERIIIIACGTSYHAALIGADLLEEKTHIVCHAEIASEFRYRTPVLSSKTLVIAISQSGETLDTLAALKEAKRKGAQTLGICNVPNSSLTRETSSTLFLEAGKEISVCSTKAFTSQLTLLLLFSLYLARLKSMTKEEGLALLNEIQALPGKVQQILHLQPVIQRLAKKYSSYDQMFFLGRHYMHPTALEAALKVKEISYIHAQGYPAGEMKHGPIALIDENLPVIFLCGNAHTQDKIASNLCEVKARKAPTLVLIPEGSKQLFSEADDYLELPPTCDELAAIPYAVATQLLAYYIALERGTDIDQPRHLAKSVTVE